MRLADGARLAGRAALDLLLPPQCLTCDAPVLRPGQFCATCFGRAGFITEPCCTRCGVPFAAAAQGGAYGLCPGCCGNPPLFRQARGAFRYDDAARRVVLPLKHGDRVELAAALAPYMARAGAALLRAATLLVPVPLHRRRLLVRRYNQAALLARALARLSGRAALPDALVRLRPTAPLGEKSAAARAAALEGAFAVRPRRRAAIVGAQ